MGEIILDMSPVLLPVLGGGLVTLLLVSVGFILLGIDKRELRGQHARSQRGFCPACCS